MSLLNMDKTEILVIGPDRVSKSISPFARHLVGNINPTAINLGVVFNQNLHFDHYIRKLVQSCFFYNSKILPKSVQHCPK